MSPTWEAADAGRAIPALAAWAGGRGRIGRSHFESVVHDPAQTLCFVCGPRAMVNESVSTLAALGVPAEAIRTEAWVVPRV